MSIGSAHQHHGMGNVGVLVGFHQRNRRHHRHRRLAHRDHMRVAAQQMQHGDDVVDVVIEIEATLRERHHARVDPFGHVDVVIGQKSFDRAAQQRRVMARHRRHDQQLGLRPPRHVAEGALEMQQPAERALPDAVDMHRHALAADHGVVDMPFRHAVAARRALEHFHAGGHRLAVGGVRQRIGRIFEEQPGGVGKGARRIERGLAHFVEPIHRRRQQCAAVGGQRRCAVEFTDRHWFFPRPLLRCSRMSLFCHRVNFTDKLFAPGLQRLPPL